MSREAGRGAARVEARPGGPVTRGGAAARLVLGPALGVLGPLPLWTGAVAHAALPVVAALHIRRTGGERYLAEDGPRVAEGIGWLLGLQAWAMLLAGAPPWDPAAPPVRLRVDPGAPPRAGRVLARPLTGLPAALGVLGAGLAAVPEWLGDLFAALAGRPGAGPRARREALLARQARLLAAQAGLVGGGRTKPAAGEGVAGSGMSVPQGS